MPRPANAEAERLRDEAMLSLCEDLVRDREAYRNVNTRRARMTRLIADKDLQEIYRAGGRGAQNEVQQGLTLEHFERLAQRASSHGGTSATALYRDGPGVLSAAYQQKIGYVPAHPSTGGNDEETVAGQFPGAPQLPSDIAMTARAGTRTDPGVLVQPAVRASASQQPESSSTKNVDVISIDGTSEGTPPAERDEPKKRKVRQEDELEGAGRHVKRPRTKPPSKSNVSRQTASAFHQLGAMGVGLDPTLLAMLEDEEEQGEGVEGGTSSQVQSAPRTVGSSIKPAPKTGTSEQQQSIAGNGVQQTHNVPKPGLSASQTTAATLTRQQAHGMHSNASATMQGASTSSPKRKRAGDDAELEPSHRAPKSPRLIKATPRTSKATKPRTPKLKDMMHVSQLAGGAIDNEFMSLWRRTQSWAHRIVEASGIDEKKPAMWVMEPGGDLEMLYESVLGTEWRQAARILDDLKITKAHELLELLASAAVNELVLKQPLPWPTPDDVLADSADMAEFYNGILHQLRPGLEFENMVWQACRNRVMSKRFLEEEIEPRAKNLAEICWKILRPQLLEMGALDPKPVQGGVEQFWHEKMEDLTYILSQALYVQALMAASPEDYSFHWPALNDEFDIETMKLVRPRSGPRQVAFCVSPMITRVPFGKTEEVPFKSALVYSRAPPEPWVRY